MTYIVSYVESAKSVGALPNCHVDGIKQGTISPDSSTSSLQDKWSSIKEHWWKSSVWLIFSKFICTVAFYCTGLYCSITKVLQTNFLNLQIKMFCNALIFVLVTVLLHHHHTAEAGCPGSNSQGGQNTRDFATGYLECGAGASYVECLPSGQWETKYLSCLTGQRCAPVLGTCAGSTVQCQWYVL